MRSGALVRGSQAHHILGAAVELIDSQGKDVVTLEDLIVFAWKRSKTQFGLKGFESKYPNANKVIVALSGKNGIVAMGCLERIGENQYRLTNVGREAFDVAYENQQQQRAASLKLWAGHYPTIRRMRESEATAKFNNNKRDSVTFQDAYHFWQFNATTMGVAVDERLRHVLVHLLAFQRETNEDGESNNLLNIHHYLLGRFKPTLELLKRRKA